MFYEALQFSRGEGSHTLLFGLQNTGGALHKASCQRRQGKLRRHHEADGRTGRGGGSGDGFDTSFIRLDEMD